MWNRAGVFGQRWFVILPLPELELWILESLWGQEKSVKEEDWGACIAQSVKCLPLLRS